MSRFSRKSAPRPDEVSMTDPEPTMPFGKHRGEPVSEVFRQDRHLVWFCEGNEEIKRAIRGLPGFFGASGKYFSQKPSSQEFDLPNLGVDPWLSREDLDRLCWEILHPVVEE